MTVEAVTLSHREQSHRVTENRVTGRGGGNVLLFTLTHQTHSHQAAGFKLCCVEVVGCTLLTSLSGGAPAGDPRHLASREVVGGGGEADGPDVLVEGDVLVQLHQGDVVVVGRGVIVPVGDDLLYVPPHCPLIGPTLHVQTQQGLPLVSLRVPA